MSASIGKVSIEAKIMIQVGDHQVELADLAAALTRAGLELQTLVEPERTHRSCPTVNDTTYAGVESSTVACLIDGLHPGGGLYRTRGGQLVRVNLNEFATASNEIARVEGYIAEPI